MSKARDSVEDLKTLDANLAAKLPKSGGALTGAVTTNSTFDGVAIATRDGILTSTTATANAALPKAGGTMTGDTLHGDNVKAKFGASSDLEIYQNGNHSVFRDVGAGNVYIQDDNYIELGSVGGEVYLGAVKDGAVSLYYNNAAKLATTSTGVDVTGTVSDSGGNVRSGRKNLIINGGMNVKQRADSHSTEGYGSLDRYTMGLSGGSATMSQEDLTLGQSDIPTRFRHYMKLNCTTGNNNCGFYHYIENPSELEGAYVLSFYAKGTNPAAGNFALSVQSSYGTGGSTGVNPHDGTLTVTSSWQRFTVAITFPSLTGKTVNDANGTTGINVRQGGSDTGTAAWALDITGMQLELGSVATDFEHRSYGEELALCQRYYEAEANQSAWINIPQLLGGNYGRTCVYFKVEKRASPSVTYVLSSPSAASNHGTQFVTKNSFNVYLNSMTTYNIINSWTADAEL